MQLAPAQPPEHAARGYVEQRKGVNGQDDAQDAFDLEEGDDGIYDQQRNHPGENLIPAPQAAHLVQQHGDVAEMPQQEGTESCREPDEALAVEHQQDVARRMEGHADGEQDGLPPLVLRQQGE